MRGHQKNMKTELLSPAKDKETAFAAIDCGADAVYIGAPAFGARKAVPNTIEDIKEVVDYAHKFWAKVYVTMNTILSDSELEEAVNLAIKLDEIGVDAIIIQDLGLLNKLMTPSPLAGEGKWNGLVGRNPSPLAGEGARRAGEGVKIPIHMSTQCDNYLPQKVKFFNEVGVSRVILARELSIEQIRQIHKENPNLELEAFVHGALCVSMSGQCYLSQSIGGRSANRGECAQPCRKLYSVETTDGKVIKKDFPALCLKDFNASNCLEEMIVAGVCSFKIEGRLKDINYVKNITAYYRQKLGKGSSSGRSIYPFVPNPKKSFNRGFTEYFLHGRSDCFNFESQKSRGEYLGKIVEVKKDCFKIKTDKEIHAQDGLYFAGDGCGVNKVHFIPTPLAGGGKWNGLVGQPPSPLAGEGARRAGEGVYTIYPNKEVKLKIGQDIFRNYDAEFEKEVSKEVKRQIGVNIIVDNNITLTDEDGITISYPLPIGEKSKNPEKIKETFVKQFSKTGESDFYIKDIKIASELPFMPISEINQLRRNLFERLMEKRLLEYKREEQKPMNYAKYFLEEVDYRANVHNESAREFYKSCGVKVLEPSFETQKPNRQVELMRCKHCIKYALNMCKSPEKLILKDSFGKSYPLKFNCKSCEMSVLS